MSAGFPPASRLSKLRRHVRGPADVLLVARMTVWCLALRALKHVLPLPALVSLAHPRSVQRTRDQGPRTDQAPSTKDQVLALSRWTARFTRLSSRGPCLERSLVLYRYLTLRGAAPRLVVGVARGASAREPVRGHAWVVLDGEALDETPDSLAGFHPVVEFEADGHSIPA